MIHADQRHTAIIVNAGLDPAATWVIAQAYTSTLIFESNLQMFNKLLGFLNGVEGVRLATCDARLDLIGLMACDLIYYCGTIGDWLIEESRDTLYKHQPDLVFAGPIAPTAEFMADFGYKRLNDFTYRHKDKK